MINLNNAEKQLLERHPSLSESLKIDDFKQLETQIETTQFDTFNTQIEKGKLIIQVEENLKNPDVIAMISDMEMTLTPKDIQRIFRISKTWYYRLKKAATFATGSYATHTKNLYLAAIEKAKEAGQEVKIDIDSYNSVAKAKYDAMKAADTTRYSGVTPAAREEVLNTLVDTGDAVTPEEIASEVREQVNVHLTGTIKLNYNGDWHTLNFKKKREEDPILECSSDSDNAKNRMQEYLRVIANQMLLEINLNQVNNEN